MMIMNADQAWFDGARDNANHKPRDLNPHPPGPIADAWNEGWDKVESDRANNTHRTSYATEPATYRPRPCPDQNAPRTGYE